MDEKNYLNEQEHEAYMRDFKEVVNTVIDMIITLADVHNVDRDNAMQHFSTLFSAMVDTSTFEHFREGEEKETVDDAVDW